MIGAVATSIGKAITVVGTLQAGEPIVISGTITGDVHAGSNAVTVEAGGRVEGAVSAREITVHGKLQGRMIATDIVRLTEKANVTGDVAAPKLAIQEGAIFHGRVEPARAEAAARVAAYRQGA
jgi:cytoskeletal protein CcmA (bactofilin family)